MSQPKRAVFFTLDGLRSTPQVIGAFNPSVPYRRPVMRQTLNEFSVNETDYSYAKDIHVRLYEYTKTVEDFDGGRLAYFCEVSP